MMNSKTCVRVLLALSFIVASQAATDAGAVIGRWALTLPDGQPGWLGFEQNGPDISASLLWGRGSVVPVEVTLRNGVLELSRAAPRRKDGARQVIVGTAQGDRLYLVSHTVTATGVELAREELIGTRIADLPPRPNLKAVTFARAVPLLTGKLSDQWIPVDPRAPNGWMLVDGVLSNRVSQKGARFANLRTRDVYDDFMLTTELRTSAGSNSGIYLRGVYEIQVAETHGKPPNGHSMGALYTRITPSTSAERPIGEWQTLKIILVARHVSVWLNGTLIIDNQPALGCTGGALSSDEFKSGPLMLQGDHSDIDYRNMEISRLIP